MIMINRTAFTRAIANASRGPGGPMDDAQRKAIFARGWGGKGGGGKGGGKGGGGGGNRPQIGPGGSFQKLGPNTGTQGRAEPSGLKPGPFPQPQKPIADDVQVIGREAIGKSFDRSPPPPDWGPKDRYGNTIPPPNGSYWDSRDGVNFYPVPNDPDLIMRPMGGGAGQRSNAPTKAPTQAIKAGGGIQSKYDTPGASAMYDPRPGGPVTGSGPKIPAGIDPSLLAFMPRISGNMMQQDPNLWRERALAAYRSGK